jgi:hypothetical protein
MKLQCWRRFAANREQEYPRLARQKPAVAGSLKATYPPPLPDHGASRNAPVLLPRVLVKKLVKKPLVVV